VILIEAPRPRPAKSCRDPLPGLLAAGHRLADLDRVGSLTGLSTSAYALGTLALPPLDQPALPISPGPSHWAIGVAVLVFAVMRLGL